MRQLLLIALLMFAAACGGNNKTAPTPITVQIGGVWGVTFRTTSIAGGECFATAVQGAIGSEDRGTIQISQTGSALSATYTSDGNGGAYGYSGTAGTASAALNLESCTACNIIGATCPNGARRDFRLLTGGVNATVSGSTMTGTHVETYNIVSVPSQTPVGTMTINSSFSAVRR